MIYFQPIPRTFEELKLQYRKLSRRYHPDVGGTEESMKVINDEYTNLFHKLKNTHVDSNGKIYHKENKETPEQLIILINQLYKAQKWVDYAQEDFYDADYAAQNMYENSFDVIQSLCCKAAKKFIISLLVFKNVSYSKEDDLLSLVDVCEEHANIRLSSIYEYCVNLSDKYSQEEEYTGYYTNSNYSEQLLKSLDKIAFFATNYLESFSIGNTKEYSALSNRKDFNIR